MEAAVFRNSRVKAAQIFEKIFHSVNIHLQCTPPRPLPYIFSLSEQTLKLFYQCYCMTHFYILHFSTIKPLNTVPQLYLRSFYARNPYTHILHSHDWRHGNQKQTDSTTETENLSTQNLASRSLTTSTLEAGKFSFPQREECFLLQPL